MSYSYDYLQARLADLYEEADHQRSLSAARPRAGSRWPRFARRRRPAEGLPHRKG